MPALTCTDDDKKHWIKAGRYWGYPECCIQFFIGEWLEIGGDPQTRDDYTYGIARTGYIPCPKCKPAVLAFSQSLFNQLPRPRRVEKPR